MILADTSVWVDHLRAGDDILSQLLDRCQILIHPFVIGEIALGSLRQRANVLHALLQLPQAPIASDSEVLAFIDRHALFARGIGYIDVHLLAGLRLTGDARLWTRDTRLHHVADRLGLAFAPPRRRLP